MFIFCLRPTLLRQVEADICLSLLKCLKLFKIVISLVSHLGRLWNLFYQEKESLDSILLLIKASKKVTPILHIRYLTKVNLHYWHVSVLQMHKELVNDKMRASDME